MSCLIVNLRFAAQIERLTIAGTRYATMGLRSSHLVSLGCALHDAIQVLPGQLLN